MDALLKVESLKKHFPVSGGGLFSKKKTLKAVDGVSFSVQAGETLAIVGESGCGKSTLGRTVIGLYKPTDGEIFYYGKTGNDGRGVALKGISEKERRALCRDLQIVFQDPYSSLDPRMTVESAIAEGAILQRGFQKGSAELKAFVSSLAKRCGLSEESLARYPHQFSGGQRQRVCIARALAVGPKFIVCDECVSALDASVQSQILNLLQELKEKEHLTYLFISHDLSVVRHVADRVGVMYLGSFMETGKTDEIFAEPLHPYTIALLSAAPSLRWEGAEREKIVLQGNLPSPVDPPTGCKFRTRCFMASEKCEREVPKGKVTETGREVFCHYAEVATAEKYAIAERKSGEKS